MTAAYPCDEKGNKVYQSEHIALELKAAGAENVHISLFEHIVDQSGLFKDSEGRPYEYSGHFSWAYVHNDFCMYDLNGTRVFHEERSVTLWRWLGLQRKSIKNKQFSGYNGGRKKGKDRLHNCEGLFKIWKGLGED